jgi:hypothetical protein
MFDSLSDRIKQDEQLAMNQRFLRWTLVAFISVLAFGGLYFGVKMLQ